MKIIEEIFNSEGPIIAITEENGNYYLMVKSRRPTKYEVAYFPIKRSLLKSYLDNEIPLRDLFPSIDSFECVNDYFKDLPGENIDDTRTSGLLQKL